MAVFDEDLKAAWPKLDDTKKASLSQRYFEARRNYLVKMGEPAEKAEKQAREDAEALGKGYYIPHVIEPSAGVDRLALALICNAYCEDQAPDEKGKMEVARGDEIPSAHRARQSRRLSPAQEQARVGEESQGSARPFAGAYVRSSTTRRAPSGAGIAARTKPVRRLA